VLKKIWEAIRGDSGKPLNVLARVAGVGFVMLLIGGVLVVGGAAGLAWTNTEAFCLGCHEMKVNVGAEYKDTIHDRNRTGVRAICPDCHVPRQPGALIARKMAATFELWGHFTGVIDTKAKFEAERPILAEHVWTRMLQTDSIECRNCHTADKMDPEKQTEKARARHAKAKAEGSTCIECHFGIAHTEPSGPGPKELKEKLKLGRTAR
jgi:cytochrome c-type protein NapC